MRAVDTNILLYAQDPRDPAKQQIARDLIEKLTDGVLLWQVACEYVNASRKFVQYGFDQEQAFRDVQDFRRAWGTLLPSWEVMLTARRLLGKYSLSFWDAVLIAACVEGGVSHLYSEDMGGSSTVEGVWVINPFTVAANVRSGEEPEEKELFDYLAEAEEAAAHMVATLGEFKEQNERLNAAFDRHNPALERVVKAGGPRQFGEIAKLNLLVVSDMNRYSRWLEGALPGFGEAAIEMKEGYTYYFNNIGLETEEQRDGLKVEREVIESLLSTMSTVIQAARVMNQKIGSLAGHAKNLSQASRRMVGVLDGYISALSDVESFCLSALDIIDAKLK
jgi:predicted nucleic acid-binding protein